MIVCSGNRGSSGKTSWLGFETQRQGSFAGSELRGGQGKMKRWTTLGFLSQEQQLIYMWACIRHVPRLSREYSEEVRESKRGIESVQVWVPQTWCGIGTSRDKGIWAQTRAEEQSEFRATRTEGIVIRDKGNWDSMTHNNTLLLQVQWWVQRSAWPPMASWGWLRTSDWVESARYGSGGVKQNSLDRMKETHGDQC